MEPNKNRTPFDNLLMAYITRESQNSFISASADKEAEIVFTKQFDVEMPKEKEALLLSSLAVSLSKDTLGTLVQRALTANDDNIANLHINTGLTPSILEDISEDMVFTNSIPVKSLAKLLKLLNISIEIAKAAIDTTFDKLSAESKMFLSIPVNAQPSFRKSGSNNPISFDLKRLKSDESYLYQNRDALDKYTSRLTELYSEL